MLTYQHSRIGVYGDRQMRPTLYTPRMIIKSWKHGVCMGLGMVWGLAAAGHAESQPLPATDQPSESAFECESLLTASKTRGSLQLLRAWLQSQGMHLVVQDCPFVRVAEGQMAQVLDVRVEVLDSDIATRYVRGPLADGEPVDMGDVHLGEPEPEDDISPDVAFNRQWLAAVMQRYGWRVVPGQWWAFVPAASR